MMILTNIYGNIFYTHCFLKRPVYSDVESIPLSVPAELYGWIVWNSQNPTIFMALQTHIVLPLSIICNKQIYRLFSKCLHTLSLFLVCKSTMMTYILSLHFVLLCWFFFTMKIFMNIMVIQIYFYYTPSYTLSDNSSFYSNSLLEGHCHCLLWAPCNFVRFAYCTSSLFCCSFYDNIISNIYL